MVVLAVDCMGGDAGPLVTLPACQHFLEQQSEASLLLVGTPDAFSHAPDKLRLHPRVKLIEATQVVTMDDPLEIALRQKKNSSMRLAIEAVRDEQAQVVLSAGNTGALMALARYLLKTLPGIDRPAIATQLPNALGGSTTVLDLGANVECSGEHLLQFAQMGSALVCALNSQANQTSQARQAKFISNPRIGLLNVGSELIKGSAVLKQAFALLQQDHEQGRLNFIGNVEGNDIFKGTADVVVCDGLVGNAVLKASEGLAGMLAGFLKTEFSRHWPNRLAGLIALPVLKAFKRRVDHRTYNGAALLGLSGLVFKSHGSADIIAFEHALLRAFEAARGQLIQRLKTHLSASPSV
jgi:glycerol-3-phosphate acyltransferase PlsX